MEAGAKPVDSGQLSMKTYDTKVKADYRCEVQRRVREDNNREKIFECDQQLVGGFCVQ